MLCWTWRLRFPRLSSFLMLQRRPSLRCALLPQNIRNMAFAEEPLRQNHHYCRRGIPISASMVYGLTQHLQCSVTFACRLRL